jgi:hypothetical protein
VTAALALVVFTIAVTITSMHHWVPTPHVVSTAPAPKPDHDLSPDDGTFLRAGPLTRRDPDGASYVTQAA